MVDLDESACTAKMDDDDPTEESMTVRTLGNVVSLSASGDTVLWHSVPITINDVYKHTRVFVKRKEFG